MPIETSTAIEQNRIQTAPAAPAAEDLSPGIETVFPDEFQEVDYAVEVHGHPIPDFVRGKYYLNGPARFGFGGFRYQHWLDGDGMIASLQFGRDSVRLRSRYVRSRKREEEHSAGRPLFRTFGTGFAGGGLNRVNNGVESPVNVSVYPFGERLLAFGEQGLPWELDPETLETRGQFTFGARLNEASPFAAHPKFDPQTGEMFNFGVFFSPQAPRLYLYCFGPEGLRYRKSVPLEFPSSVHDFSLSRNYAVFYLSPYLLDIGGLLQESRTVMESLRWEPHRGSRIVVLARQTGDVVASIPVGNRYCLHLINAFEDGDRVAVDVLEFDEPLYGHYQPVPNLFESVPRGGPVRFLIDVKTRELVERRALAYDKAPDFPAIPPQRVMHSYDDFWMLGISAAGLHGRKFFDQLVHATWSQGGITDTYQSPPMRYLGGEPVMISDPGSTAGEGVVICQEFDAQERKSSFLVFDARRVTEGPMTRMPQEKLLYLGFHAVFSPEPQVT